jgi:RNase H-fold protein (predicted Holliday junction resolvase)
VHLHSGSNACQQVVTVVVGMPQQALGDQNAKQTVKSEQIAENIGTCLKFGLFC